MASLGHEVRAFCLVAPNHYLDWYWLLYQIWWHSPEVNFTGNTQDKMHVKVTHLKLQPDLPRTMCGGWPLCQWSRDSPSQLTATIYMYLDCLEAPFTSDFSIAVQIWWKCRFAFRQIEIKWSLQNFADITTAVLPCAKIWSDLMATKRIEAIQIFQQI